MEGVVYLFPHSYTQFAASRSNFSHAIKSSSLATPGVVAASSVSTPHYSRKRSDQSINRAPRPPSVTKRKMQNINQEVSPHRTVAAIRLLRIERGRAFADLLNAKGKGSGKNEIGYVERTLRFRTQEQDNRDIRLILRIGFFNILKLNIPSYAVVHEVGEVRWGYLYLVLAQLILQKQGESPVFSAERSLLYNLHMDWSHQILSQKMASILESSKALHGRSICSPPGLAT